MRKGNDCCSAGTSMARQDLLTLGAGRTSKRTNSNENDNFVQFSEKYLSDSQRGSHGLITYASDKCAGGNETLTKPCPKVCKDTIFKNIKIYKVSWGARYLRYVFGSKQIDRGPVLLI